MSFDLKVLSLVGREDGWLIAEVPLMPGCVTQARSEEELQMNVADAFGIAFENMPADPENADSWYPDLECVRDYYLQVGNTQDAMSQLAAATISHYDNSECSCADQDLLCSAAIGMIDTMRQSDMPEKRIKVFAV